MSDAADLLEALTVQQSYEPMSDAAADKIADDWRATAVANALEPDALDAAAGDDLQAYILKIFGRDDGSPTAFV